MNTGSVSDLAAELGMGERQLRRLFAKHLGANPHQVAHTERVLMAKRLLDETDLPMADLAAAAGFNSVRRFNEVIRAVYDRTPRDLRRARRRAGTTALHGTTLRLAYRPPYDWRGVCDLLVAWGVPGIEEVVAPGVYRRVISVGQEVGLLEVRPGTDGTSVLASFHLPGSTPLFPLVQRVRQLFDLDANAEAIDAALARDSRLSTAIRISPGSRVPGCWDPFEIGVRAILGQKAGIEGLSLAGRIAEEFGEPFDGSLPGGSSLRCHFPRPEALAEADLHLLGIPGASAECVRSFAVAVASRRIDLESLADASSVADALERIGGVDPWTAAYIAMRVARDPDAFLETDLGVRGALAHGGKPLSPPLAREAARAWQPWRAYAVVRLWELRRQGTTA